MPLLPQAIADLVEADGLARVAVDNEGTPQVLYLENETVRSVLASAWPPPLPADPTPAQIQAAIAARDAARQRVIIDAQALRQVITIAQSAVGIRVDLLTAVQVRALIAVLLRKNGALDRTGTVRPLDTWLD